MCMLSLRVQISQELKKNVGTGASVYVHQEALEKRGNGRQSEDEIGNGTSMNAPTLLQNLSRFRHDMIG